MLDREEYVEQAYLFQVLGERLPKNVPLQELLHHLKQELLATSRLPMALDFMLSELRHSGSCSKAMQKLSHYFAPFQTYVMSEAEEERGRFDMRLAAAILEKDAEFRAEQASPAGMFFFQFEALSRNRLRYDPGLLAIAHDPLYDQRWREWILNVRRHLGMVELSDLVYLASDYFVEQAEARQDRQNRGRQAKPDAAAQSPDSNDSPAGPVQTLFGVKEGKIAAANRRKDPLFLFAALQRHLGYPEVPRPKPLDDTPHLIPQLMRRIEQLESRIKLLEDENREGIDITRFYKPPQAGLQPPPG